MPIIDFSKVINLKEAVQNEFGEKVHFHDACGGQYFTLENTSPKLQKFITEQVQALGYTTEFSPDGLSFTIGDKP